MKKKNIPSPRVEDVTPQQVGANIRELRRRVHLSQAELAQRLGMRQGPVCNLEQGRNFPSAQVLLRLATILNVTTDQILRPVRYASPESTETASSVKETPAPYTASAAVSVASTSLCVPTSPVARKVVQSSESAAVESAIRDYLSLEDICRVPRQACLPLQMAFSVSAPGMVRLSDQFRALLGIGDAVVFDPLELFENHGLRVVFMPMAEANSFSFHDAPNANVFIFIRHDLNPEKQMFSLVYELGRILLYTRAILLGESPFRNEAGADKSARHFAACFLMPEHAVQTSVGQTGIRPGEWNLDLLLRLKHRFGVSAETFNYRLLELGLMTPECQSELRGQIKAHYDAHAFAEPGRSRRILSPNGRLGDLLHVALRRADSEAAAIKTRLGKLGIRMT